MSRSQPPGRLVPVAGGTMHLLCQGEGSPTVVLDAGLGGSFLDWAAVQPEVARFTRVCALDRPGYGWSQARRSERTSLNIVRELEDLLRVAGIEAPYVMVGHSFGGFNMRLYAARHPETVRGLVLVDASHQQGLERLPPAYWRAVRVTLTLARWMAPWGGLGIADALGLIPATRVFDGLPASAATAARRHLCCSRTIRTIRRELKALPQSQRQVAEAGSLGDLPVVVLTSNVSTQPDRDLPRGISLDDMRRAWRVLQAELLALSSRSRQVRVEDSGHYIAIERPQPVIRAILATVQLARAELVGAA